MKDVIEVISEVTKKIIERESLYNKTWLQIPTSDLIAVARIKTFRASTLFNNLDKEDDNIKMKLIDDLIDATAYLLFSIIKIKQELRKS